MDQLRVDGARIEARWWHTAGDSGRAPIVLLHEGLGSVSAWRDFPADLAARTERAVFAYSRRGYGQSDPRGAGLPVSFMHDEAREHLPRVLDAAGIPRAVLCGHSDGASIALLAAATHPARVEALILEAPHVFVERLTVDSIARIGELYRTSGLRDKLARHHAHVEEAFGGWNAVWLAPAFQDWNIEACLERIQCAVLVIQGTDDEYGTLAQISAIARGLRAPLRTRLIQNCGHSPHRDAEDEVLSEIRSFLAEIRTDKPLVST